MFINELILQILNSSDNEDDRLQFFWDFISDNYDIFPVNTINNYVITFLRNNVFEVSDIDRLVKSLNEALLGE